MYAIRWLILCVVWEQCVKAYELRCDRPLCAAAGKVLHKTSAHDWQETSDDNYTVDGHPVSISFTDSHYGTKLFTIECHGWAALDSDAMPKFTTQYTASSVKLKSCPPPKRTLSAALQELNVTIYERSFLTLSIYLYQLPPKPALTKQHFEGFEHISDLKITYLESTTDHVTDIVGAFERLQNLELGNVSLPITEYRRYNTLQELILENTKVQSLRYVLAQLSYLLRLGLIDVEIENTNKSDINSNAEPSRLQILALTRWKERRMAPMKRCENMAYLMLLQPLVEELPNGFLSACPKLETLIVTNAWYLDKLPSRFLEGATGLKRLNMTGGVLEVLPAGLLEGAPLIRVVDLSNNRIRTIANDISPGPLLRYLSIASNQLEIEALNGLASMTSLTELDLGYNPTLTDLCEPYGYSKLATLRLRKLSLAESSITRICRENMALGQVDLRSTKVNTLTESEFTEQSGEVTLSNAKLLKDEDNYIQVLNHRK